MKITRSFKYAFKGIHFGLQEYNMKVHVVAAVVVIASGWFFSISKVEWVAVVLAIGLVITAELMNTALEEVCDMITAAHADSYAKAGKPKDIGAGAVLVTSLTAAVVGLIVFIPHIYMYLK